MLMMKSCSQKFAQNSSNFFNDVKEGCLERTVVVGSSSVSSYSSSLSPIGKIGGGTPPPPANTTSPKSCMGILSPINMLLNQCVACVHPPIDHVVLDAAYPYYYNNTNDNTAHSHHHHNNSKVDDNTAHSHHRHDNTKVDDYYDEAGRNPYPVSSPSPSQNHHDQNPDNIDHGQRRRRRRRRRLLRPYINDQKRAKDIPAREGGRRTGRFCHHPLVDDDDPDSDVPRGSIPLGQRYITDHRLMTITTTKTTEIGPSTQRLDASAANGDAWMAARRQRPRRTATRTDDDLLELGNVHVGYQAITINHNDDENAVPQSWKSGPSNSLVPTHTSTSSSSAMMKMTTITSDVGRERSRSHGSFVQGHNHTTVSSTDNSEISSNETGGESLIRFQDEDGDFVVLERGNTKRQQQYPTRRRQQSHRRRPPPSLDRRERDQRKQQRQPPPSSSPSLPPWGGAVSCRNWTARATSSSASLSSSMTLRRGGGNCGSCAGTVTFPFGSDTVDHRNTILRRVHHHHHNRYITIDDDDDDDDDEGLLPRKLFPSEPNASLSSLSSSTSSSSSSAGVATNSELRWWPQSSSSSVGCPRNHPCSQKTTSVILVEDENDDDSALLFVDDDLATTTLHAHHKNNNSNRYYDPPPRYVAKTPGLCPLGHQEFVRFER